MNKRRLTTISFLISILLLTSLSHAQTFLVKRVIDGDTIQISNIERVRLISVDTPETNHPKKPVEYFGKEASAFTNEEGMGIMFKKIQDRNREFIGGFVRDYL